MRKERKGGRKRKGRKEENFSSKNPGDVARRERGSKEGRKKSFLSKNPGNVALPGDRGPRHLLSCCCLV